MAHARGWPIASARPREIGYMLAVQVTALGALALTLSRDAYSTRKLLLTGFFLVIAVVFEEAVRRAARLQMRLSADLKRDMTSVWTVAAAVALPPSYAAVLIAALTTYLWFRQRRPNGHPMYRGLFNVAAFALSTVIADVLVHRWEPTWHDLPWALGLAVTVLMTIVLYSVVNRLFASIALIVMGVPLRELRGTREDNFIEIATLCLGGLAAVAALYEPWLCVLVLAIATGSAAWWALREDQQVLFSGLSAQDAAAVAKELDRQKLPYKLADDGGTILMASDAVHKTRLKLMANGGLHL